MVVVVKGKGAEWEGGLWVREGHISKMVVVVKGKEADWEGRRAVDW
jgi:hypothetical protein